MRLVSMNAGSQQLYSELLEYSRPTLKEFLKNFPLYPGQLSWDEEMNSSCISLMYDSQRHQNSFLPRQDFWPSIQGLKVSCTSCWKFYLNPRNNSIKYLDIRLGKNFEQVFMGFLKSRGLETTRGDVERKNYPDILVLGRNDQPACYLELKYLTAPFVKIFQFVAGRECYEGSTTIDTGAKILSQRKIVENEITVPVFYVYWLDYPCIKGVFHMESSKVYEYIDSVQGTEWVRKERTGDSVTTTQGKLKIAQLNKAYLPLLYMGNFKELFNKIQQTVSDKS